MQLTCHHLVTKIILWLEINKMNKLRTRNISEVTINPMIAGISSSTSVTLNTISSLDKKIRILFYLDYFNNKKSPHGHHEMFF